MKNIFTIVIPLFNKENFVAATIKSVLNQSFQEFEVLIVDDCSTDNSIEVAQNFISDKIKIIKHNQNKGLSASRNTGILNAKTEFIVFLDADDLLKPKYLKKLNDLIFEIPSAGLFATNYEQVYQNHIAVAPKIGVQNSENDQLISDFFIAGLQQPIYCQSSLCVRKSIFETIELYNEKIDYAEDVDFNIRANFHFQVAYSSEKLVQYVMIDSNQITKNSIIGKTLPDFDSFESWTNTNSSLKKYLDLNRYMLANVCKKQGDFATFQKLKNGIHPHKEISGLNQKQIILLNSPVFLLKVISKIKIFLLNRGFRFTSFS